MKDLIRQLEDAEAGNHALDDSVVIAAHNGQMMDWYDDEAEQYAIQAEDGSRVNVTPVTTSIDAALGLAEAVLGKLPAMALLSGVVEIAGSTGLDSSRIPLLICTGLLYGKLAEEPTKG